MVSATDSQAVPLPVENSTLEKDHELPFNEYHSVGKEGSQIAPPPDFVRAETGHAPAELPFQEINWDGPNDELNPMNWPSGKKWRTLGVISLMAFITLVSKVSTKLNH